MPLKSGFPSSALRQGFRGAALALARFVRHFVHSVDSSHKSWHQNWPAFQALLMAAGRSKLTPLSADCPAPLQAFLWRLPRQQATGGQLPFLQHCVTSSPALSTPGQAERCMELSDTQPLPPHNEYNTSGFLSFFLLLAMKDIISPGFLFIMTFQAKIAIESLFVCDEPQDIAAGVL